MTLIWMTVYLYMYLHTQKIGGIQHIEVDGVFSF